MAPKARGEERVRSIEEIRGRYGLGEEEFRALPEGHKDRRVGTVVGRQQHAPAKKFVATEQAVMGTARLEPPVEVAVQRLSKAEPVAVPMEPVRWVPVAAVGVIVAVLGAFIVLTRDGGATPQPPAAAPAEVNVPKAKVPVSAPSPKPATTGAAQPQTVKPGARSSSPTTSASATKKRNNLYPDLD